MVFVFLFCFLFFLFWSFVRFCSFLCENFVKYFLWCVKRTLASAPGCTPVCQSITNKTDNQSNSSCTSFGFLLTYQAVTITRPVFIPPLGREEPRHNQINQAVKLNSYRNQVVQPASHTSKAPLALSKHIRSIQMSPNHSTATRNPLKEAP